ncbi:TPA: hypothetical protein J0A46_004970 [Escherichia coli]|nr:hypothetical protein [Escherichia coli]
MLGGADNPNGELPSYITGADTRPVRKKTSGLGHVVLAGQQAHPAIVIMPVSVFIITLFAV